MRQLTNAFPTSLIGDPFYIAMPPPFPLPLPLIRIILPNSSALCFLPRIVQGRGRVGVDLGEAQFREGNKRSQV